MNLKKLKTNLESQKDWYSVRSVELIDDFIQVVMVDNSLSGAAVLIETINLNRFTGRVMPEEKQFTIRIFEI